MARIRGLLRFVDNSRQGRKRLEDEVEAASQVQRRLFPGVLPVVADLDYAGACRAARGVSGDYFDFFELPSGRLAMLLADVCGKGMPAALLAASLHAAVRAYAPSAGRECGDLLVKVNRLIFESTTPDRFVTVFYAVYDPADRVLTWTNAGHCPPLCVRGGSEVVRLDSLIAPAGMLPDMSSRQQQFRLERGDRLVVSDGILEARNPAGEEFGDERLAALARTASSSPAAALCDLILDQVGQFSLGAAQEDDMTVVSAVVA
jgi:sigma-B regulation protein RsbU (phosphoserine phosphatase)